MLACAVLLASTTAVALPQAEATERPNLVLIVADDQGYADAGFMGSKSVATPALDALARSGAVLTAHYAQPACSPSRAALLTGRLPTRTGVYTLVPPGAEGGLPPNERTLAQVLRDAGYETSLCGKWHLGDSAPEYRPTSRGFEHQYGCWSGGIDYFTHERDGVPDWHRNDQPLEEEGYSTELITAEACRRIREKDPDRPLFLVVSYNALHAPLKVPESYKRGFDHLTGPRRLYASTLAALDEGVGEIVDALRATEELENTLIVYTSDNGGYASGEVTDNAPLRAGKGTIYEGGIRVITCVSWPGHIPAGRRIDEPVQIVDWFPTLARIAGAPLPQGDVLDGLDILPVLTAGARSPHSWILVPGSVPGRVALRQGDWKLLIAPNELSDEDRAPLAPGEKRAPRRDVPPQLFDLAHDLGEQRDLASEHPERVQQMVQKVVELLKGSIPASGR